MALESVDYSEEKACQILNIVMQEDNDQRKLEQKNEISATTVSSSGDNAIEKTVQRYVRLSFIWNFSIV